MTGLSNRPDDGSKAIRPIPFSKPDADAAGNLLMLLKLMGGDVRAAMSQECPLAITLQRIHEGQALFHEGARAHAVHVVRVGTFKSLHTAEDGHEQLVAFVGRTEVLGFDAVGFTHHPTSAVALDDARVYSIAMSDLPRMAQMVPELDRVLRVAVSSQLRQVGAMADLMSAVSAEARLARFLLQLSQRMRALGLSPRRFWLRMSRRDIANYLGIAHETVSRCFGSLAQAGHLAVDRREVEILNMDGLKEYARGTRRVIGEVPPGTANRCAVPFSVMPPLTSGSARESSSLQWMDGGHSDASVS